MYGSSTMQVSLYSTISCLQRLPLAAMLTMPNLALSKDVLDFGTCLVGQRRELQIILSNPTGSDSFWMCTLGINAFDFFTSYPT